MNLAFFCFFVFELIAKIIGQGIVHYMNDKFNWFDGGVVLISAIDISLEYSAVFQSENSGAKALTAFRVVRLIRVF